VNILLASVLTVSDIGRVGGELTRYQYSQLHMGGRVAITLYSASSEAAEAAAKAGFAEFARLEDVMSDYRPASELMRLCEKAAQRPVEASPDLFRVVSIAQKISAKSHGAFDITCGPVVALWRRARETKRLPPKQAIQEALREVGYRFVRLDPSRRTIQLLKPGMKLDLGGIGKGYACDAASAAIRRAGCSIFLIEAGGNIRAGNPPPNREWRIGIGKSRVIAIENASVSTSGDAEQFVEIGGRRYSHIVDPRTGIGVTNRVQVTVIGKDGAAADALSTALCVLGERAGKRLAKEFKCKPLFLHPGD